jgi:ATP-dependent helicase HrpB
MLAMAGPAAAPLAALLEERDPLRGSGPELLDRLRALDRPPADAHRPTLERIRAEAKRLARAVPQAAQPGLSPAQMAALAYPDRIGLRRPGEAARYLLSGGRGAILAEGAPLGRARLIVATGRCSPTGSAGARRWNGTAAMAASRPAGKRCSARWSLTKDPGPRPRPNGSPAPHWMACARSGCPGPPPPAACAPGSHWPAARTGPK